MDASGRVDYAKLAENRSDLDRFLASLREAGPESTPELFPEEGDRLAYYLNAYNALVFEGVLESWPDLKSVWGLGTGYAFFVRRRVRLDGMETNLKKLEDRWIREAFSDPRVHAALNCASIGCPRLPTEPFLADRLEAQLDRAMTEMVSDPKHCRFDPARNVVELSKIFDWFREDFGGEAKKGKTSDQELLRFVNRYRGPEQQLPEVARVKFLEYDKGLNAQ